MFAFAEAFPLAQPFYLSSDIGEATLPEWLGLPRGTVVLGVAVLAAGGFDGATRVERWMAKRSGGLAPVAVTTSQRTP